MDLHDIGKNIFSMAEAWGLVMYDQELTSRQVHFGKSKALKPDIIGMSSVLLLL